MPLIISIFYFVLGMCFQRYLGLTVKKWQQIGENCIMRSFKIFTLTKYYFGDQIKANEVASGQVLHSRINRHMYRVLVGKFQGWDHLEDSGTVAMMILKCTKKNGVKGVDWISPAPDMEKCWAAVNAVMNLWVLSNASNFLNRREKYSFSKRSLLHVVS